MVAYSNMTLDKLTPSEKKVYLLMIKGDSNIQISEKLDISVNTVKTHVKVNKLTINCVLVLIIGAISILSSACGDPSCVTIPLRLFPQQKGQTDMETQLIGNLVLTDATLRVETESGASYLPIWPKGYSFCSEQDGTIEGSSPITYHITMKVLNKKGQIVAQTGEGVIMAGVEVTDTETNRKWLNDDIMKQHLPFSAMGPFWLVGKDVSLINSGFVD